MIKPLLLAMALAVVVPASNGQTVWRCGPDAASYTDAPCPGGREVAVADARSAAERADAREVAARERRLALRLVVERRQREREYAERGSGLTGVKPAAELKPPVVRKLRPGPTRKRQGAAAAGTSLAADRASRQTPG